MFRARGQRDIDAGLVLPAIMALAWNNDSPRIGDIPFNELPK